MQLDTHVRNLLDMFANSGQPKIWEVPPAEARNMALALTQMVEGKEPIVWHRCTRLRRPQWMSCYAHEPHSGSLSRPTRERTALKKSHRFLTIGK